MEETYFDIIDKDSLNVILIKLKYDDFNTLVSSFEYLINWDSLFLRKFDDFPFPKGLNVKNVYKSISYILNIYEIYNYLEFIEHLIEISNYRDLWEYLIETTNKDYIKYLGNYDFVTYTLNLPD